MIDAVHIKASVPDTLRVCLVITIQDREYVIHFLIKNNQGSGPRNSRTEPPEIKQITVQLSIYGAMSSGTLGTCSLALIGTRSHIPTCSSNYGESTPPPNLKEIGRKMRLPGRFEGEKHTPNPTKWKTYPICPINSSQGRRGHFGEEGFKEEGWTIKVERLETNSARRAFAVPETPLCFYSQRQYRHTSRKRLPYMRAVTPTLHGLLEAPVELFWLQTNTSFLAAMNWETSDTSRSSSWTPDIFPLVGAAVRQQNMERHRQTGNDLYGVAARALSSHLGVTGSITSYVIPGILHVGFVPDVGVRLGIIRGHASPPGRTWDAHKMEEAIRNKTMGWKKAAQVFGVPKTTLMRLAKKYGDPKEARDGTYISNKEQSQESIWSSRGWAKLLKLFLRRHKNLLSVRKPTGTSYARATSFTQESVSKFHDNYAEELEKNIYTPDRIWNVDESGLSIVLSKIPGVIELRRK
ncbi:hypothetical protein PR048_002811 [Dryococelus australis]|uniref:HTH psq-type domain-containing protein n=1 Tax=Dryococelus australis TaxID=614101 RepID=A0ABQ9IL80_9NEOP|nr:hypothetical protein PR048_002811 [Dryococelus australis]